MTVLALRALGLGDLLTGVAALRGVRRAWPGHRLVLAAPEALGQWLTDLGVVDAVLPTTGLTRLPWPWSGPGGAQDAPGCLAVNLHGRGPQSHRALQATQPDALIAFGNPAADHPGPHWDEDEHEVLRWCRLVSGVGGRCGPEDLRLGPADPPDGHGAPEAGQGVIVVHPGASAGARRWPAPRWSRVVRALTAQGLDVTLTGSPAEQKLCRRVRPAQEADGAVRDTSGRLSLPALADLVSRARLVVSSDTGVAHLATAYGTPSVTLFGPTSPALWGPAIDPARHLVIWHGEPGEPSRDPNAERLDPALARVTAEEVVDVCESALRQPPAPAAGTRPLFGRVRPAR
ncbi:glycosyltransferase family 9 protein [Myceligenerans pegani]|uniref:Glycosyltransferase family 9 protein n=1 Tax=Myceligenerans pegani TaxID=2776917 RepID=A0ABR9N0G5_9MICO|nr:glycosyltransferase family 9 protein [Myceligenerans sp. TRM 65318]MBE1876563.1 glycosyltransferase family 9 protein [Myceligenerans sp. TRM 65318]MBE3018834.1 glycosyltransferase family 9 protein [Myceligenerans sp. TRM 65318]